MVTPTALAPPSTDACRSMGVSPAHTRCAMSMQKKETRDPACHHTLLPTTLQQLLAAQAMKMQHIGARLTPAARRICQMLNLKAQANLGRRTDVVVRADACVALARPSCRDSYKLCSIAPGLARVGYA